MVFIYIFLAAAFLVAASGVCVRPLSELPTIWLILAWVLSFLSIFLLLRLKLVADQQNHPLIWVLTGTLLLVFLTQSTGGDQSPLLFSIFLLMGVIAWEGKSFYAFSVALIVCLCEALTLRHSLSIDNISLYLRWFSLFITAFFLAKVVQIRRDKERLNQRLVDLKNEADQLAVSA